MSASPTFFTYLGVAVGGLAVFYLVRMKGFHLLLSALFIVGIPVFFLIGYLLSYPALSYLGLSESRWIFLPGLLGIVAWIVLAVRAITTPCASPGTSSS